MGSVRPSYFLSPSWDLQPQEVVLGSVITSIKLPQRPLLGKDLQSYVEPNTRSQSTSQVSGTASTSNERSFGLFSSFIQTVMAGAELSYAVTSTQEIEYSCEQLDTTRFEPSTLYMKTLAENEAVTSYLKFGGLNSKLFIITGVKTATGVTITTSRETGREFKAQVGLNIPEAELKVGPQGLWNSGTSNRHGITIAGPIVFAYQVEKLKISRKGELHSNAHVKGAMLGKQDMGDFVYHLSEIGLDESELEDMGLQARQGSEEGTGEQCEIVW